MMWRGVWPRARAGKKLTCPACKKAVASGLACTACGFEGQSRDFRTPRNWRLFLWGSAPIAAAVGAACGAEVVRGWVSEDDDGFVLGPMRAMAVGVVLFATVLSAWSWRGDRSRGRRRCPKCWYDMSGSKLTCPECGHDAKAVKNLYRPRRRWIGCAAAAASLLVAYGVWVVPAVREGGPVAAVPTWVLIAGLPWLPDWMTIEDQGKYDEDWTLYGRVNRERTWQVERWMLRKRARGIVASGPSVWGLARASEFLDEERDADMAAAVHLAVVKGLTSADQKQRHKACDAAGLVRETFSREALRPYLPKLIERLDDSSFPVRQASVYYVTHFGDDAAGAVPRIIECIRRLRPMGAFGFVMGLERLCKESDVAVHLVIEASHDEAILVRRSCAMALGTVKAFELGGTQRLFEMLDDADEWTASAAARSLCKAGAEPDIVIPRLLAWADGGDTGCYRLPSGLHHFGLRLQPYVHRLGKFLDAPETRSDVSHVIGMAAWKTGGLDWSPLLDRIVALTTSDDPQESSEGVWILEGFANRFTPRGSDEE